MNGFIAAAGRCTPSHGLWASCNQILLGLAGPYLPGNNLTSQSFLQPPQQPGQHSSFTTASA